MYCLSYLFQLHLSHDAVFGHGMRKAFTRVTDVLEVSRSQLSATKEKSFCTK